MCGFLFVAHRGREVDRTRFDAAFETMRHRGPDAHAVRTETLTLDGSDGPARIDIASGHHRLAILDLDPRSDQPFARDGRTLLYNGEIYNFAELRDEAGTAHRTSGDTEVLFNALSARGLDALSAMNGMWAFCFLDPHAGEVLAARDRHGKKPLFFHWDADTLCVASTLGAISAYLGRPPVFEDAALDSYLAHGALFPSGGFETHFRGLRQVPPGGALRFDLRAWVARETRWFSLEAHLDGPPPAQDELPALIADAARLRLVSDRKVGLLLSGGVDSSIVLSALAAQGLQDRVTCFIGEAGRSEDARYARACVDRLGIEATTIELGYGEDAFARFLRMCRHHEKPFPLIGNSMAMSEMYEAVAGHGIVVALDGTGGDEQFGGYWSRQLPFALREARARGWSSSCSAFPSSLTSRTQCAAACARTHAPSRMATRSNATPASASRRRWSRTRRADVSGFLDAALAQPRYLASRLTPRLLCVAGLEATTGLAAG